MAKSKSNLENLRTKKNILKNEIEELEDIFTFDNTKESLSAFTHGFTDKFLGEELTPDGETKTVIKTPEILSEISTSVKNNVLTKDAIFGFANSDAGSNFIENTLKISVVTFVGNYARENIKSTSWKKKAIGLALIYVAPIILRNLREKLEDWQKHRTTESLGQLI